MIIGCERISCECKMLISIAELRGLSQQSDIGFISIMEQLRYCTVGSFYKNPKNAVWVMGSETHLSGIYITSLCIEL